MIKFHENTLKTKILIHFPKVSFFGKKKKKLFSFFFNYVFLMSESKKYLIEIHACDESLEELETKQFSIDDKLLYSEFKRKIILEYNFPPFTQVQFFNDPDRKNQIHHSNHKIMDFKDSKTNIFYVKLKEFFYKNTTPNDLINQYNEIYDFPEENADPKVYFEIPKEYFHTPLSQIPLKQLFSRFAFSFSSTATETASNEIDEYDENEYGQNDNGENMDSEFFDIRNVTPSYHFNSKILEKDPITDYSFDAVTNMLFSQTDIVINVKCEDFDDNIQMNPIESGLSIKNYIDKMLQTKDLNYEIGPVFLKNNGEITQIQDDENYLLFNAAVDPKDHTKTIQKAEIFFSFKHK